MSELAKDITRLFETAKKVNDLLVPMGGYVSGEIAINLEGLIMSKQLEAGLPPYSGASPSAVSAPQTGATYTGERSDLKELLGCEDWVSTAFAISSVAKQGNNGIIRPGDYFRLPIKTEAGSFGGLNFEALDISEAEITVVHTTPDGKIIFNFEEILFYSAINAKNTNKGGFKGSALCKYLNEKFLDALHPIRNVLQKNKDGNLVTLPTHFEVFGDNDDDKIDSNWEEKPRQFEYFKKIKNRIRVKNNDTYWWWLSTPVAPYATAFASVHSYGHATTTGASGAAGGVAPAICVS